MAYGTVKVDNIVFTNSGVDQTITVSGIVSSISGNITATGTISGNVIQGGTLVSGATVTGTAGQFGTITGNTAGFTTVTGTTVTGTTANFTSGVFQNISGGTHTITSGVFASGTAAAPSITFTGDLDTGIYSPAANQIALTTSGAGRLFVNASGDFGFNATPEASTGRTVLTVNGTNGNEIRLNTNGTQSLALITASGVGILRSPDVSGYLRFDASGTTERMRITSSGFVGIGTTGPVVDLDVAPAASTATFRIHARSNTTPVAAIELVRGTNTTFGADGSGDYRIKNDTGNLSFEYGDSGVTTERLRIDSSGRLLVGTSGTRAIEPHGISTAGTVSEHVFEQTDTDGRTGIAIVSNSDTTAAYGSFLYLARTRGSSVNTNTSVSSGDTLGTIAFAGADGTDIRTKAAAIFAEVDATPGANDMPGRLVFATTPNGAATPTERMRIDSTGRLLVGTATGETASLGALFQIQATNSSASALIKRNESGVLPSYLYLSKSRGTTVNSTTIVQSGDSLGAIRFTGADGSTEIGSIAAQITAAVDGTPGSGDMPGRLIFATTPDGSATPTERMRIDSAGRLLVGHSASIGGNTTESIGNIGIYRFTAADSGPFLNVGKSRSATTGTNVIVQADDNLGTLAFYGANGTGYDTAAWIRAAVDGTPGTSNDMPGRLIFATTSDGAATPTERMRISNSGTTTLTSAASTAPFVVNIGVSEVARIDSLGRVGIGTNSPSSTLAVGGNPPASGAIGAVGASGGIALALSDNINSSLYVRTASGGAIIGTDAGGTIRFATSGNDTVNEKARIDNQGRLLVGTITSLGGIVSIASGGLYLSANDSNAEMQLTRASTDSGSPFYYFNKARGTYASPTVVSSGDICGTINFRGHDGSAYIAGASITAAVDNTPGSGDMPGRLIFATTSDGAAAPTERMRIDSAGKVTINGTVTGTVAQFTSLSGATIARSAPVTKTGNFTWSGGENWIICSGAATITGTLPTASSFSGRELMIKTVTAQSVISASSNVVALTGGAAGTAILANTIGKYATLVSDGTNWIIMQAN